jgi:hypothetical protein
MISLLPMPWRYTLVMPRLACWICGCYGSSAWGLAVELAYALSCPPIGGPTPATPRCPSRRESRFRPISVSSRLQRRRSGGLFCIRSAKEPSAARPDWLMLVVHRARRRRRRAPLIYRRATIPARLTGAAGDVGWQLLVCLWEVLDEVSSQLGRFGLMLVACRPCRPSSGSARTAALLFAARAGVAAITAAPG